jgi:hypothetical protein
MKKKALKSFTVKKKALKSFTVYYRLQAPENEVVIKAESALKAAFHVKVLLDSLGHDDAIVRHGYEVRDERT